MEIARAGGLGLAGRQESNSQRCQRHHQPQSDSTLHASPTSVRAGRERGHDMRFDAVWPRVMRKGNEWVVPRLTVSQPYSYRNLDRAMPVRPPHNSAHDAHLIRDRKPALAQRSGRSNAEVGGSSPPRPTTVFETPAIWARMVASGLTDTANRAHMVAGTSRPAAADFAARPSREIS